MSERDTGGFAFPLSVNTYDPHHPGEPRYTTELHRGMTLRDYFAANALALTPMQTAYNMKDNENYEAYRARRAYAIADAMLEARK